MKCGYIGSEGIDAVVTVGCIDQPVGRYVTLVRDAAGPQAYIMNICEVEVSGSSGSLTGHKKMQKSVHYMYFAQKNKIIF